MADDPKGTAVGKWLISNGAGEDAQAFYDQGYTELEDVTAEAIDDLIKKKGTAAKLKRLLAQSNKPKKSAVEPMPPPDLPAGTTFDLTAPVLQHADVEFRVPSALSVDRGEAAVLPTDIKPEEWMVIAFNSKLIYGYDMRGPAPARPREPVLYWKVPAANASFMRNEQDHARVTSSVTYTSESSTYVRAGFDKETASAGYAFCSASFERSHKERHARSLSRTRRHMVGFYQFPRATVFLDACTTVSPKFVDAVTAALEQRDPGKELESVMAKFGHVVPSEVLLGGQLTLTYSEETDALATEDESEEQISAAVSFKVGQASGGASFTKQTSESRKTAAEQIAQNTSFEGYGGDTRLVSTPSAWGPTVGEPNKWAVIRNIGITSTLNLLPDDLKARALQFWRVEPDPLPPATTRSPNINYRATTDGFVSAHLRVNVENDGSEVYGLTDSASDPKTCRASAGCHWYKDEHMWSGSLFMPVRAKEYYNLSFTPRWGGSVAAAYFQSFPLALGEWERLEPNIRYPKREQDGFVVARLQHAQDGNRGNISGRQSALGQDLAQCVASSIHWYDHSDTCIAAESFCMPVVKGSDFIVDFVPTYGNPLVEAYWIPIGASNKMLPLERREINKINVADTNGILFGYLNAGGGSDSAEGTLSLTVAENEDLKNPVTVTGTNVQYCERYNKFIPCNSVTAVVRKGTSYRAVFKVDAAPVTAVVSWVGIVPA
ncbi:MAC/Perforin domain-containing protein [Bradyrhizobium brasilense]|uniref:MAC/Perforin domain-containing protein n=1 Tax=Bradyrhizobium brasilense TaxID=1419277 RepID=A0A1G7K4F0_9BRAD|nr:MAC/perforin domain-containing protein [Bradyrhizobium brasilense]SDF31914.1 MAC/Perforin domain-containing protein [Bradyrhizobium brasilense]